MSGESTPGRARESRPEAARVKAKAVAKKAAEHVVEVVGDGFDKVIESIDELQKPRK